MSRRVSTGRIIVAVILGLGLVGCAGPGTSPPPTLVPSALPSTVPASAPPTSAPIASASVASLAEPPAAALAADGGDPVVGSLGSFTWADGGSDSPWLPGAPIALGSGEPLTIALDAALPLKDWTAKRVAAGSTDGLGAVAIAEGASGPITFPAPEPGSWSVQVTITFGDDLGSAAYYWAVTSR